MWEARVETGDTSLTRHSLTLREQLARRQPQLARLDAHLGDARACFGGHTHVPGVFEEGRGFQHQANVGDRYTMSDRRCLVNIGSVGQPRDGDPRASYVLIDGEDLLFRRVEYDVRTTMKKIAGNPSLDDFLAKRLKVGQ